MADTQLDDLPALTAPAVGDLAYVVDVSDTTDSAQGSSKKITLADLRGAIGVDVQEFTADGTWTKPAGAKACHVTVIGAGAGGGSGRRGAAGSSRRGGGGGGPGQYGFYILPASYFGSTESVTIGTGGGGGAAVSADDTNGNAGTGGGNTTIGNLRMTGGSGGAGGQSGAGGTGGGNSGYGLVINASSFNQAFDNQPNGGAASNSTGAAPTQVPQSGPCGGGGGGAIDSSNLGRNGGAGGTYYTSSGWVTPPTAGSVGVGQTSAGGNGATGPHGGSGGGGGGGGSSASAGYAGGNGGDYGAGGGGGGGSPNSFASGAGGNGAGGYVRVVTFCGP